MELRVRREREEMGRRVLREMTALMVSERRVTRVTRALAVSPEQTEHTEPRVTRVTRELAVSPEQTEPREPKEIEDLRDLRVLEALTEVRETGDPGGFRAAEADSG
jgi:signal recognition particle subunit SEC65